MIDRGIPLNTRDKGRPLNMIGRGTPLNTRELDHLNTRDKGHRPLNVIGRGIPLNTRDKGHHPLNVIGRGLPLNTIDRGHHTRGRDLPLLMIGRGTPLNSSRHLTSSRNNCLGAVLLLTMLHPLQVGNRPIMIQMCHIVNVIGVKFPGLKLSTISEIY